MSNESESNKAWDVFSENHFLGHVTAPNEEEAAKLALQIWGGYYEGILRVKRRVQTPKDGWSRPI